MDLDAARRALRRRGGAGAPGPGPRSVLRGDLRTALDLLARAVAAGWSNPEQIRADPDLQSLAASPRPGEILAHAEATKTKLDRFWNSPAITAPYSERLSEDVRIAGLSRAWAEAKFKIEGRYVVAEVLDPAIGGIERTILAAETP